MRILITNDDGIEAPGIRALAEFAMTLGEVLKIEMSKENVGVYIISEHNTCEAHGLG